VQVTFTRLVGPRYAIDVLRRSGPPAGMRVAPTFDEHVPHDLAHFLVEREFGLKLGIFGQLAAGGDAGTFWAAPADRTARLAQRAHRLQVTGRGDLGRSERLVAVCVAAWEHDTGRRPAPLLSSGALIDATDVTPARLGAVIAHLDRAATHWHDLTAGETMTFNWPARLTVVARPPSALAHQRLRSA
jgi:hypothetical protein